MIRHHLKDGTILHDMRGHVVRKEDVPSAYALIDLMNERETEKSGEKYKKCNS